MLGNSGANLGDYRMDGVTTGSSWEWDLSQDMHHFTGSQSVTIYSAEMTPDRSYAFVSGTYEPTGDAMQKWVADTWTALYNAAQATFYSSQQSISNQIAALQSQISGVDTLTLRREENDEIMKGVLRWLLGPSFDFMPASVVDLFSKSDTAAVQAMNISGSTSKEKKALVELDLDYGISFTGNALGLSDTKKHNDWSVMFQYQEMVKFINEAIEWEETSFISFTPTSGMCRRVGISSVRFNTLDSTRQAFLRSGSARVVLTVRQGY